MCPFFLEKWLYINSFRDARALRATPVTIDATVLNPAIKCCRSTTKLTACPLSTGAKPYSMGWM